MSCLGWCTIPHPPRTPVLSCVRLETAGSVARVHASRVISERLRCVFNVISAKADRGRIFEAAGADEELGGLCRRIINRNTAANNTGESYIKPEYESGQNER